MARVIYISAPPFDPDLDLDLYTKYLTTGFSSSYRFWGYDTGTPFEQLTDAFASSVNLRFPRLSPDGNWMVGLSQNTPAVADIYNRVDGKWTLVQTLSLPETHSGATFSPDSTYLVTWDGIFQSTGVPTTKLRMFKNVAGTFVPLSFPTTDGPGGPCAWSPDGIHLITAGNPNTDRHLLFKRTGDSFVRSMTFPVTGYSAIEFVGGVAVSLNGTYVAILGTLGILRIYKRFGATDTYNLLTTINPGTQSTNASLCFSPNGDHLAVVHKATGAELPPRIYKRTGDVFTLLPTIPYTAPDAAGTVSYSADNTLFAVATTSVNLIYDVVGDTYTIRSTPELLDPNGRSEFFPHATPGGVGGF